MGAAVLESDDSEPSKSAQRKSDPSQDDASKDAPREIGVAALGRTTATSEPLRKTKTRRSAFEGDVAAVELRARLASTRDGIPPPEAPVSAGSASHGVLRLAGFVLVIAATAGVAGYVVGAFAPSPPSTQPAPTPVRADIDPALPASGPNLEASQREPELPAVQAAAIDLAPADTRRSAQQLPQPATGPRAALPSAAASSLPPASARDDSEIAAKMKIGAGLMANGDVAAARMMFERAAEAGSAAAAFALAETYDPLVLGTLRLRGGIAPDFALARRWYERARDLGSSAAPERIARLPQSPR